MNCKLWTGKAFPYADGLLPEQEARAYRAHLSGCPDCSGEVAESLRLIRSLRSLPDPEMAASAAASFDRQVLARVTASSAPARSPASTPAPGLAAASAPRPGFAPARVEDGGRAAAARSIAARSRQAGRPASAPLPSLMLVSLAVATVSIATMILFGDWMVRTLGSRLTLAATALGDSGQWLAERVGAKVVEFVALHRILRGLIADVGPWVEGVQQLMYARGIELMLVAIVSVSLLGLAGLVLRRGRSRARAISRR